MKPLETNEYFTKDSFNFVKNIRGIKADGFSESMDIESLFTNLPLNEAIENYAAIICLVLMAWFLDLIGENLKKNMDIATQENMFMFDGKFYKQTDAAARGSS